MKRANEFKAMAAVLAAATLWGTAGTLQGILPSGRDPAVVAFLRVAIAAGALMLLSPASATAWRHGDIDLQVVLGRAALFMMAGFAIAAYNLMFFAGVSLAGVAVGTAFALGSGPIWVALFGFATERTLPGRGLLAGQCCAISGLIVMGVVDDSAEVSPLGILLSLGAGMAYAAYSVLTYRLTQVVSAYRATLITFSISAIVMSPLLLFRGTSWLSVDTIVPLLFLGCFATAFAFILFSSGISRIRPTNAVSLALAEPLTAWLLAVVVLQEHMTTAKVAGAVVLLSGLIIMTRNVESYHRPAGA